MNINIHIQIHILQINSHPIICVSDEIQGNDVLIRTYHRAPDDVRRRPESEG